MTTTAALDLTAVDPGIRPQDDLYRHANGAWLARTEIPADKPGWGAFAMLRDEAKEAVREIITGLEPGAAPGTPQQQIADLYASYLDEDRLETLGAEPLREPLAAVDGVETLVDLARVSGTLARQGIGSLFGIDVDADPGNPQRYIAFVGQAGLGLPDESYYREEQHAAVLAEYRAHVGRLLALAGVADPEAQADLVVDLETRIAACHWDRVRTRDMQQMYNPMSLADLDASAPALHLRTWLDACGIPEDRVAQVVNAQPSFFADVAALLTEPELTAWRAWLRWHVVSSLAMSLSRAFVEERFGFVGTTLSGTPEQEPRWKRGVTRVESILGEAVGRLYVERHFSPVAKERMDTLVANLVEAYRQSIEGLTWMTDETRAEALVKLSKFRPKIGYPARWRDYSGLEIRPDDLVGNIRRAAAFHLDHEVSKLGGPMDPDEWMMFPQTVNAYYHPLRNEIVFPAAILQPPFFHEHADEAVNYGAIGAVIGHEIGHGFDDQGSTCDGDGVLRNWWTDADRAAFEERTAALVGQFDVLSPEGADGRTVNGRLTIGENIGDLGGLSIALKAYRLATAGQDQPSIDGLTPEQRLFFAWAAVWRSRHRPEAVVQALATDPHSPNEFRCNQIVRNIDDFHAAFGVTESDAMWLAPRERVSIW